MLAQASRGVHQLGGELDEVAPARGLHPVAEGGQAEHLVAEVGAVLGVELLREQPQVVLRQAQRLAQVLDDALHRVGGDGPGKDGELGPEALVHAPDQLVPYGPGEVEVDVGEH